MSETAKLIAARQKSKPINNSWLYLMPLFISVAGILSIAERLGEEVATVEIVFPMMFGFPFSIVVTSLLKEMPTRREYFGALIVLCFIIVPLFFGAWPSSIFLYTDGNGSQELNYLGQLLATAAGSFLAVSAALFVRSAVKGPTA